ncbi:MAG: DUF1707 domain-containing protein [Desulfobacteraceae bacterium]|jgi:hypothetical protein
MPVNPYDKPIELLREETIDQITVNYSHGEISLESFERRLDQALDAKTHKELTALTEDLDLKVDNSFKEQKQQKFNFRTDAHPAEDVDQIVNIFGGTNRKGAWEVSKEIRMVNIFGGADVDFSEALFSSKKTHIKVTCLFGGADIFAPEGINVITKVICIFGGVDNTMPSSLSPDAPVIVVEGFVIFGGVSIKLKKTFKERLSSFANSLKRMIG